MFFIQGKGAWRKVLKTPDKRHQYNRDDKQSRARTIVLLVRIEVYTACIDSTVSLYRRLLEKDLPRLREKSQVWNSGVGNKRSPDTDVHGNCLVELYSLEYHSSYEHAFVYIRQLAMQKKTKEAFQTVYCWQHIHCLKLWVAVLVAACPNEDSTMLRSLISPLTEVILGTVRLVPFPTRHLPMRLRCVRHSCSRCASRYK
jgi:hypothetical protein